MKTLTYIGFLSKRSWGKTDNILFLSSLSNPLAEQLQSDIARKRVTARYWITDKQATKEQAQEDFVRQLVGIAECDFGSYYSEYTGYLWTDEECRIGGHDLIRELRSHVGKWLILEVDVYAANSPVHVIRKPGAVPRRWLSRLVSVLKRHANIWWLATPLAAIGLGLHLSVAAIHYRTNGDPWYLVIFFGIVSVGAVVIWRTIRAFRPSR